MGLFEIDAYLVQSKVVLDPLKAFSGRFKLGKVIVKSVLRADDCGNH